MSASIGRPDGRSSAAWHAAVAFVWLAAVVVTVVVAAPDERGCEEVRLGDERPHRLLDRDLEALGEHLVHRGAGQAAAAGQRR